MINLKFTPLFRRIPAVLIVLGLMLGLQALPYNFLGVANAAVLLVSTTGADNPDCSVSPCLTIGHAMSQSSAGDTVLVATGTYNENIQMTDGVHLLTNEGALIQGNSAQASVFFDGTGPNTILEGFTITRLPGLATLSPVLLINASAEILGNSFIGNSSSVVYGGALAVINSSARIVNNLFDSNQTTGGPGGAIAVSDSTGSVSIINNTMFNNLSDITSGGLHIWIDENSSNVLIQNNIISGAHNTGTISSMVRTLLFPPIMNNNLFFPVNPINTFYYQESSVGVNNLLLLNSLPTAQNNIDGDPLFINPIPFVGDFRLQATSPAIDAGENTNAPVNDIDGDARPLGATVDIGFDEADNGGGPPLPQCSDNIDNDGDFLIDFPADPGCTDANDNDETDVPQPPPADLCNSLVTTVAELQSEVDAISTSTKTRHLLTGTLTSVQRALDKGKNKTARNQLASFIKKVLRRSHMPLIHENAVPEDQANSLICGAANLIQGVDIP